TPDWVSFIDLRWPDGKSGTELITRVEIPQGILGSRPTDMWLISSLQTQRLVAPMRRLRYGRKPCLLQLGVEVFGNWEVAIVQHCSEQRHLKRIEVAFRFSRDFPPGRVCFDDH